MDDSYDKVDASSLLLFFKVILMIFLYTWLIKSNSRLKNLQMSLNLEKWTQIWWTQVKLGGMGLMLLGGTSNEDGSDVGVLPFLGLNFRF